MRKPLLLNLLFAAAIIYLAINLGQIWGPSPQSTIIVPAVSKTKQDKSKTSGTKKGQKLVANLSSYKIIGQRNLFRPQRKEWVKPPPPPKPKPKPKKKEPPPPPPPPPPEPLPDPFVLGIIIGKGKGEDERVALMQGHKREEIPTPVRRSRRGRTRTYTPPKRYRIQQEPMGRYHVGDTISEARIVKILKDRVVLNREGKVFTILLRDPKRKKKSSRSTRGRSSRSRRR